MRADSSSPDPPAPVRPREEQEPASPEVAEVAPGILRLQLPIDFTGLGHVNSYALLDRGRATVVDAGLPGPATWRALRARLRDAGLRVRDVQAVVVTHSHPDHFGSAGRLAHEAHAPLVAEERFHTWLEPLRPAGPVGGAESGAAVAGADPAGVDDTGYLDLSRPTPWGGARLPFDRRRRLVVALARRHLIPSMRPPVPSRRVRDGDVLRAGGRDWAVLHTPGHTADHLCLWDRDGGVLLSGDHVLPTITPHVSGLSPSPDPLRDYLASLERLRELRAASLVLPAHGNPFADLAGRIDTIEAHHAERLAALALASRHLGRASVVDLSHELFRPDHWGLMAESETYAHLEYLRHRGLAERWREGRELLYEVDPAAAALTPAALVAQGE
jgi:glyoxylase-like metal-dependent hydrolase (beta-lactamase superfamily II)